MARTKHTDPPRIRAERRAKDPRASRGSGDISDAHARARVFKELGITLVSQGIATDEDRSLPRITTTRPRVGFTHPLDRREIRRMLAFVGPIGTYGASRRSSCATARASKPERSLLPDTVHLIRSSVRATHASLGASRPIERGNDGSTAPGGGAHRSRRDDDVPSSTGRMSRSRSSWRSTGCCTRSAIT